MSYSRFLESQWYSYPTAIGCIEVWHAGDLDKDLHWSQEKTLEQFLAYVKEQLPDVSDEDMEELKDILEANTQDIMEVFMEYNKKESR